MRTPIIGRPRHLSRNRRASPNYTLNCDEPLTVPDDIAVPGFDNWEIMALASGPQLTTVDFGLQEVGCTAAQLLLKAVHGEAEPDTVVLPTQFILRSSTIGE